MSTQLVVASTLFGAMTAAAAADAGLLGTRDGERVLLVVNNAPAPELTPALDEIPGAGPVLARFDRVVHLTDLLAPVHPSDWRPGTRELPMLEELLRRYWGLGDGPVDIVCESVWVNPAQALARVFHASPVTVYADGLMSYGPTRNALPLGVAQRLDRLLHLDLVPGLRPALLTEYGVPSEVIPTASYRALVDELAAAGAGADASVDASSPHPRPAVVVGQYLSALGLVTAEEEADMHAQMVRAAADAGAGLVRFKPHPSAPPGLIRPIEDAALECGVELEIVDDPLPVEVLLAREEHRAVVGCFSTALATAPALMGTPSVAVGTGALLERLRPFANSNRVPLVLVDALHRDDGRYSDVTDLQQLVDAVAYVMQPNTLKSRHAAAAAYLAATPATELARYFDVRQLGRLDLPGGVRPSPAKKALVDTVQRARRHPLFADVDHRTRDWRLRRTLTRTVHS